MAVIDTVVSSSFYSVAVNCGSESECMHNRKLPTLEDVTTKQAT